MKIIIKYSLTTIIHILVNDLKHKLSSIVVCNLFLLLHQNSLNLVSGESYVLRDLQDWEGTMCFYMILFFFLKKKRDSFFFINFGLIDDLVLYSHLNGLTREDMLVCKAKLNWNYEETWNYQSFCLGGIKLFYQLACLSLFNLFFFFFIVR